VSKLTKAKGRPERCCFSCREWAGKVNAWESVGESQGTCLWLANLIATSIGTPSGVSERPPVRVTYDDDGGDCTGVAADGEWGMKLAACIAALLVSTPALADPCKLIPDTGPMSSWLRGGTFQGPVSYVGDGDGLCIALGPDPSRWVEVRLADFYAPELREPGGRQAKATLDRLTAGKVVRCVGQKRSYDRVVAYCTVGGRSLGDLMRAAGVREGGRGQ